MDPIVQMIVDILRRGKEKEALSQGGQDGGEMPLARPEPKHAGRGYEEIIASMS
jgi:hypothetical protein